MPIRGAREHGLAHPSRDNGEYLAIPRNWVTQPLDTSASARYHARESEWHRRHKAPVFDWRLSHPGA